jgi:ribulose-5-phosphate 4-epimerase/fuculose-1-phosphate aldolase
MNELVELARALGGIHDVQGPGGNVSIKRGDELVVKASGVRLRDLERDEARACVPIAVARAALDGDPGADEVLKTARPRPSLETYFHAIGARVVAHTHPVGVLALACAREAVFPSLTGAVTRVVPYARPGRALALAVRDAIDDVEGVVIVVLRSHGVIVYADTVADAVAHTRDFDAACRAQGGDPGDLAQRVEAYRAVPRRRVVGGFVQPVPDGPGAEDRALFPDAAVFCPWLRVASLDDAAGVLATAARPAVLSDGTQRVVVAPTEQGLDFAIEVLAAHDALEETLGARALPLDAAEALAVANMPSELYRLRRE